MAHQHVVYDTDTHFSIIPITREIINSAAKVKLIQYDHNSERFTFEVPRYIEEHDVSQCSKIEVHYINISGDKQDQHADVYTVNDVQVSPATDDVVIFSWLLSGNATQYAGTLNFLIKFTCLTGTTIDYVWNTGVFSGITIASGMNNGEVVIEEYSDILAEWEQRLNLVPKPTAADKDKVLTANADGTAGWKDPKGGLSVTEITSPEEITADSPDGLYIQEGGSGGSSGGTTIHYYDSLDAVPADLPEGSFVAVPSPNNVIDLTKYKFEDGQSFNDKIFYLFGTGETSFQDVHDGSFWSDLSKTTNPVFSIDMSLMEEGQTSEIACTMLSKVGGVLFSTVLSFEVNLQNQLMKVTVEMVNRGINQGYPAEETAIELYMRTV